MHPALIVLLLVALAFALLAGSPQFRARFAVWRRFRTEKSESRADRRPPFRDVDAYHQSVAASGPVPSPSIGDSSPAYSIDERTWSDLDLDQVFTELDHTRSRPGQQYLRHVLRSPSSPSALRHFNQAVSEVTAAPQAARDIRRTLGTVDDPRASYLVDLIFGQLPERPLLWWIFPLLTFGALASIAASFFEIRALIALVAIAATNICVQLLYRPRVEALIPAIHQLPEFMRAARKLGALAGNTLQSTRQLLAESSGQLFALKRATSWLRFEPSQEESQLKASLYMYLNMIFLVDVNAFMFTINNARRARPTLQRIFNAIGYVDAAQSVAHWRTTVSHWCVPEFTREDKHLEITGVVHPLVAKAVPNDLVVNETSVLITGSNMSGKTTLVRAIGVNTILAQTISTALATRWRTPFLHVGSSIGRSDSVIESRSYYLAEVESIRSLVARKGDGQQHLFLIDELFRGTNTAERVAAAYGVLEYLNRGTDIVIVATHDTELLGLLGNTYAAHHFREDISPDGLVFDYIMRDGQATTRNAIALLEVMKYPDEIVQNARKILS